MRRIGIQLDMVGAYGRDVLRGVMEFANGEGNWEFVMPPMYALGRKKTVNPGSVDGLVAMLHDARSVREFRRAQVPTVNVAHTLDDRVLAQLNLPSVLPDDAAIGRLAYSYFRDRGFRHFGFCGHPTASWSRTRERAFAAAAAADGHAFHAVHLADAVPAEWLRTLPLPVAVLAGNDRYAWHAVDACRDVGLRMPEDVAVLGVDNDRLLTDMVRPTLSSIRPAAFTVGYEAGRTLADLLRGGRVPTAPRLIPPDGIVTRHSTDVLVIDDDVALAAARFIREHGAGAISIDDVADATATGRRTLERRFKAALGRSLHDELRRVRLERAMHLLRDTSLDMPSIAERCGFSGHARFSTVFRKHVGTTPTAFRRRTRPDAVAEPESSAAEGFAR
jgi:LacI family transcriptional regulator